MCIRLQTPLCADCLSSSHINSDGDPVNRDFSPSPNDEHSVSADLDADDAHDPWLHSGKLQSFGLHSRVEGDGSHDCRSASVNQDSSIYWNISDNSVVRAALNLSQGIDDVGLIVRSPVTVSERSALLPGSDILSTSCILYLSDGLLIRKYTQVMHQVFADWMQDVGAVDEELLHCYKSP